MVDDMGERLDEYHLNLGRFVTQFAETEAQLRVRCAVAAEVSISLSGPLFGELTVHSASQMLKKLLKAKGEADDPILFGGLDQLGIIATTRNAILHRGVDFGETAFVTSAGLPNSRKQTKLVDADILIAMIMDLQVIKARFALTMLAGMPGIEAMTALQQSAGAPWRYKPQP